MSAFELQEFLSLRNKLPILDVRTPAEYEQGHIHHSHNMPLFTNEERVVVGTLYKQQSPQVAFKKGLELIGPKLVSFIEFAEKLGSREVLVHCWRGGMRSQSVATLLGAYGFKAHTLRGGYKNYRQHALSFFEKPLPIIVLTGYTGSMKTQVLQELQKLGEQVVDLEGLACHQGSAFGRQGAEIQPSSEQFQNLIYEAFKPMDLKRRIWLEDESMRIGGVEMMVSLYYQKSAAPYVFLDIPREIRIQNLIKNYEYKSEEKLIRATESIKKRFGVKETAQTIAHIKAGEAEAAAQLLLTYYDRRYYKSIAEKEKQIKLNLPTSSDDPLQIAKLILEKLDGNL